MRPLHPCGYPSCPSLVSTPRCPAHTTERHKDPEQQKFYGSTQWKAIRTMIRRRDPICKMCLKRVSTRVDHIDGNWRNNDLSNLRGLCNPCDYSHSGSQHQKKLRARGGH